MKTERAHTQRGKACSIECTPSLSLSLSLPRSLLCREYCSFSAVAQPRKKTQQLERARAASEQAAVAATVSPLPGLFLFLRRIVRESERGYESPRSSKLLGCRYGLPAVIEDAKKVPCGALQRYSHVSAHTPRVSRRKREPFMSGPAPQSIKRLCAGRHESTEGNAF